MAKKLKVEARSVPWLYLALVIPLVLAILAQFGILDLTSFSTAIITIFVSLFVLSEVGALGVLRGKKLGKDPIRLFGSIVALFTLLVAALSLFGITWAILDPITGVGNLLLVIYVVIEAFR